MGNERVQSARTKQLGFKRSFEVKETGTAVFD